MDYQVNWSPEAVEDVEEIAQYIEKDSPHYAQAVIDDIVAASRSLKQLAIRGRQVPEIEDDIYRELFNLQLSINLPYERTTSINHCRYPR